MEETTSTRSQNSKRIAKNTLMLYFRTMLTMLVTLYTSRVILNTLGIEDFGIYSVVGGIVLLFGFFNSAMSNATQRFLSYEIGKNNPELLGKTFNGSLLIHIGIAILICFFAETLGLWFVKNYLVVPKERMDAAIWVYHFSVLAFMVSIIQVPYNAAIIAHERMKVYAYVSILEVILKLLIVFVLTWLSFDKLKMYGVLYFGVVLIIAAIYIIYTRLNFKETKFEITKDKALYRTLIMYSVWSLFGNLASVAKGQGVNILLNIFFGPTMNAARGVATQVQGAVNSFFSNFQTAVNPQIIKSYASNDKDYMMDLVIRSSKLSFYLLFLLSLPIIIEVDQILLLWLKTVPEFASIFTVLILIVILIDSISGSLMTAVQATGKIKMYQIVVGSLQLLIIPISYFFLKLGHSPEVTLYVNIVISIVALVFRVFFVSRLLHFPILKFIKGVILRNILVVLVALSLPLFILNQIESSFMRLFLNIIISFVWGGGVVYILGLSKIEKEFILKLLKKIEKHEIN